MSKGLFYTNIEEKNNKVSEILERLEMYSDEKFKQVYVLNKPLMGKTTYNYEYLDAIVIFIPNFKIIFLDLNEKEKFSNEFEDYVEDYIEDIGHISKTYNYTEALGRPRNWKENLTSKIYYYEIKKNFIETLEEYKLVDKKLIREGELLISLVTGSINDISRVKGEVTEDLLESIKKKIILFDGDQTRFIYQELPKKIIKIHGLAGTGKTELLLHKLKELYVKDVENKIVITCHNKILQKSLKQRIPNFFDFMKVDEQIKWNERLWCISAWGSKSDKNSGLFSYICSYYNLDFKPFGYYYSYKDTCIDLLKQLSDKGNIDYCFDYILIDESQDFPKEFIELCDKITKKKVYVAGDIFQNIYDIDIQNVVSEVDFLLNKCYRTDPKTLMFAHALGMGLFEKEKISWLPDEGWIACGYDLEKRENKLILSRQPLRRFEDLKTTKGLTLYALEIEEYKDKVIDILKEIKKTYPNIIPEDIAIIFVEDSPANYKLMDFISIYIENELNWKINKGYETKEIKKNTILISNKNNIKGLEFPFIICISTGIIDKNIRTRNSLYMILTRSFLSTYFIFSNKNNEEFVNNIEKGLENLLINERLEVISPTLGEIEEIKASIKTLQNNKKPLKDMIDDSFKEISIDNKKKEQIKRIVQEAIITIKNEDIEITEEMIKAKINSVINLFKA